MVDRRLIGTLHILWQQRLQVLMDSLPDCSTAMSIPEYISGKRIAKISSGAMLHCTCRAEQKLVLIVPFFTTISVALDMASMMMVFGSKVLVSMQVHV